MVLFSSRGDFLEVFFAIIICSGTEFEAIVVDICVYLNAKFCSTNFDLEYD